MSEGVNGCLLGDLGIFSGLPHRPLTRTGAVSIPLRVAIEQVIDWFESIIIFFQDIQQALRYADVSVLGTFAFAYTYLQSMPVDVIKSYVSGLT